MDSLSQAALGACVGYAVAGRQMGTKAIWWGALAGTIPDLDILPLIPIDNEFTFLKHHRGFSHSIIFCLTGAPFFAYLASKLRGASSKFTLFLNLFFWGFATHILLDCFTTWGTQVFWPHPYRVAWNSVFIVDFFYTAPLLVGIIACLISYRLAGTRPKSDSTQSSSEVALPIYGHGLKWITAALAVSSVYLLLSLGAKVITAKTFDRIFEENGLSIIRYKTRPTPLNIILWTSTAETKDGYYYATASVFDRNPDTRVVFTPKNHELATHFNDQRSQELIAYTKGYYTVSLTDPSHPSAGSTPLGESVPQDTIFIHDLRYGFMGDPWLNGKNYVFTYKLSKNGDKDPLLEVINPRPKNSSKLLKQLWERIKNPT